MRRMKTMGDRISLQFKSGDYKSGVLYAHWDGIGIMHDVHRFLDMASKDGMIGQHQHEVKDGKWFAEGSPFKQKKDWSGKLVWQCPICKMSQDSCSTNEWVNDKTMMPLNRMEPDNVMFNFIVYLGIQHGDKTKEFPYMDSNYRVEQWSEETEADTTWDNGHKVIDLDRALHEDIFEGQV